MSCVFIIKFQPKKRLLSMDFPRAVIRSIEEKSGSLSLYCDIDKLMYKNQKWVGIKYLAYLKKEKKLVFGRWHKNDVNGWFFTFNNPADGNIFNIGDSVECMDGYYGERAEIILNESLEWEEKIFNECEDYEHCYVCCATFDSESSEGANILMISSRKDILCRNCFNKFVTSRDVYKMVDENSWVDDGKGNFVPRKRH